MRVIAVILTLLSRQPLRWILLHREALAGGVSPSAFRRTLRWLIKHRYVERPERGLYRITERGRGLLENLPGEHRRFQRRIVEYA